MATRESMLDAFDRAVVFVGEQNRSPYYLALDYSKRRITIHVRPEESPVTPQEIPTTGEPRVHSRYTTQSTVWVGPFKTYSHALATAKLLADFHHRDYGEDLLVANGRGVVLYPKKPF